MSVSYGTGRCKHCDGDGVDEEGNKCDWCYGEGKCQTCGGDGIIECDKCGGSRYDGQDEEGNDMICSKCDGEGSRPCPECY